MLGEAYLWVKAFHIISVIFWMAGMFMLPRYFAYHIEAERGSVEDLAWRERERRLLRIIINPSMIAAWILGLTLAFHIGWDAGGWLHLKVALLVILSGFHGVLSKWRKNFITGENLKTSRTYRIANEVPAIFIIIIVILAVTKPF